MSVFIWWQNATDHPMLDVKFFKNPRFSAANVAITLTFFAMFGSMFMLTQFMQFVLGFTPLDASSWLELTTPAEEPQAEAAEAEAEGDKPAADDQA